MTLRDVTLVYKHDTSVQKTQCFYTTLLYVRAPPAPLAPYPHFISTYTTEDYLAYVHLFLAEKDRAVARGEGVKLVKVDFFSKDLDFLSGIRI